MSKIINMTVYRFNELNEDAKAKAISDEINNMLSEHDIYTLHKNSNLYKAINKAEEMLTPWFLHDYVWVFCEKQIMKVLNKLWFYEDGEVCYNVED